MTKKYTHWNAADDLKTEEDVAVYFDICLEEDPGDGNDLDLLVDPLPGTTLFDLGGLQVELESLLSAPVDMLTPGDLPIKFRAQMLAEAHPV